MMMRIRLFNMRKRRERLARLCGQASINLTCKKCKAPHQPALYEGGLCKSCFRPKQVEHVSCSRELRDTSKSQETLKLQEVCQRILDKHHLSRKAFALRMKVGPSSIYLWRNGDLGRIAQERLNAKIRAGIEQHFDEVTA